jgi:hypothetical protein
VAKANPFAKLKAKAKAKAPREGSAAEERMDRMQGVPGAKKPNPFAKGKPFAKGGKT